MRTFTEEGLRFEKVEGVGSIALVKRSRTIAPYDSWYVIDQMETCDGYRKRTTRTQPEFAGGDNEYQKRLALMKARA